jgi:hypothetical protein
MSSRKDIVCWWSGGVTSAVACKLAIDLYGIDRCVVVMIDTRNEDDDTERFRSDCERWYETEIRVISAFSDLLYEKIQDVWTRFKGMNFANGAICSSELKRAVRVRFQKENPGSVQVFGFDIDEPKRAKAMAMNYPESRPVFTLLLYGMSKQDCIKMVQLAGIRVPNAYLLGFKNNNCLKTGCVQGGIGYWQKMDREFPEKVDAMAEMEHYLTDLKGSPVTMLKDQSRAAKESGNTLVFLRKHPDYPQLKCLADMPPCKVEPVMECNGFCGTNDLEPRKETEKQLNFEEEQP